jgi:RNA polymerase sigma-70 factor (ECF subfamily)
MLQHREDAEDVAQEVFLRAFRSLKRWDCNRPLKPWILMIAANRCRTLLERRARQRQAAESLIDDCAAPAQPLSDDGLAEEIERGLATVRDEHRLCFVLFYRQELSCLEIAEIMNCPLGTVKTRLHRVRRELADYLQQRGFGPEAGKQDEYELHRI